MEGYILMFLMVFYNISCSGQGNDPVKSDAITLPKEYESCCGTESVETRFGKSNSYVYIPNAFTPNGDGVNDLFKPFIGDGVLLIRSIAIISAVGDTVLFKRRDFDYKQIDANSWTGYRENKTPYVGLFKYSIEVISKNNELTILSGQACAIQCGATANAFKTKAGCYFPNQAKSDGTLNKEAANQEAKCFN